MRTCAGLFEQDVSPVVALTVASLAFVMVASAVFEDIALRGNRRRADRRQAELPAE
jgi:putative effector of murein hydrolase LrgA (UPF0299 family)